MFNAVNDIKRQKRKIDKAMHYNIPCKHIRFIAYTILVVST